MEVDYDTDQDDCPPPELPDLAGLPSRIIVTNVPSEVFVDVDVKREFESLIRRIEDPEVADDVQFNYFKSFKRVQIQFSSSRIAALARIHIHDFQFRDNQLRSFFCQTKDLMEPVPNGASELELPALEKQFLISPPASPPVGWEQSSESAPVIDFELLARLAALKHRDDDPEEVTREIFPQQGHLPGIVVHVCGDDPPDINTLFSKQKIQQTRCPER